MVSASVMNLKDLWRAERGGISRDEAGSIGLDDALVDTDCIVPAKPESMITDPGLRKVRTKRMRPANGSRMTSIDEAARLDIQAEYSRA